MSIFLLALAFMCYCDVKLMESTMLYDALGKH
jgi:hypothetical protein